MGHNASQATRRANALGAYLGDVRTWRIVSECSPCRRRSELEVGALAERFGDRMKVAGVVNRLRCATCRTPPSAVAVGDRYHMVPVVGPGSMA